MANNVLIVDDSQLMREKVVETLKRVALFNNYYEADDGINAIKVLSKEEIGMVISDVTMPRMDGFKMLDLDNFKEVNDFFGHQCGDTVLKEIGRLLQVTLRGYDFAVRYGGDEFIIVLSQNTAIGAHIVGERIRKIIEDSPILKELNGGNYITASVGVATYPDDTTDGYESLINKVDNALYLAKREGRNRVVYNARA